MAVSVAVCEMFSVNMVRVRSRSLEMAPFDRSHSNYGAILLYRMGDIAIYWLKKSLNFYTPPVFISPAGGDPVGIS